MPRAKKERPYWVEIKRRRAPQDRVWEEVVEMLLQLLPERPVWLLCWKCLGAHSVCDSRLCIRCTACHQTTYYKPHVLFFLWNSFTWHLSPRYDPLLLALKHFGVSGSVPDVDPRVQVNIVTPRGEYNISSISPTTPVDLAVVSWRRFL